MISNIWNWIKNIFKPEKQDPHLTLYEEVKPVFNEYTNKDGKSIKCGTHKRYKKSCPICREAVVA